MNEKILIVEDDAVAADNLKEFLMKKGYAITGICAKGEEAVQKANESRPDLILMDIRLGGDMDGVEACNIIHKDLHVPVIYLTALSDEKTLERAEITGPFGFISKPYKMKDIISNVRMALYKNEMKETILLVDDNDFTSNHLVQDLKLAGFEVLTARTLSDAKKIVDSDNFIAAILNIWFHVGEDDNIDEDDRFAARGGFRSGLVLARWIKIKHPNAFLIAYSHEDSEECIDWFRKNGNGFLSKTRYKPSDTVKYICKITGKTPFVGPKCFIVHGHDDDLKNQLKDYLINILKFPEPIILREQPNLGRSIIEKFEEEAKDVDIAFILLTPDDKISGSNASNKEKRRARQNVIFEMGYFLAKFGRKLGRVILLYKGKIELPTDISGLVYIDISNGIEAAGEEIRREVAEFLPPKSQK